MTLERPPTATGAEFPGLLPPPNCPDVLSPQHRTLLSDSRAHAWPAPTVTEVALKIPGTVCGTALLNRPVNPSWPCSLSPQQRTVPLDSAAHVKNSPAASETTRLQDPETHICGAEQSESVTQPLLHAPPEHPPGHGCAAGATHWPPVQALWPMRVEPEHIGPDPHGPVGYTHSPATLPVHVPAHVPLPHDRPAGGAPVPTTVHFPSLPARLHAIHGLLQPESQQ
jgi:hypothetical protein